ncbi:hypothetical protein [uncultured Chryseobacterium sp.]|uniref:hypothetical protein n=1 Tax=uncultured Chryseobacterium sp. TaxID=259322 RepID=UPI0025EAAF7F|nr:hypothetical protein [uncultured Chryseobacterium sp.]
MKNLTTFLYNLYGSENNAIKLCAYLYGLYAVFLLIECIDFLSMLHTPDPGTHPTYDIVHVAFFIVELIVYAALTLGFVMLLNAENKKPATVIILVTLITAGRAFLDYYLYWYSEPKVHFVPYIYKTSNNFSDLVRATFLPAQLIAGLLCIWLWAGYSARNTAYDVKR